MYTFGCNDEGTLGRDTSDEGTETVPGKVDGLPRIVQVCAGDSHTAALSDDGRVYAWGNFRVSVREALCTVTNFYSEVGLYTQHGLSSCEKMDLGLSMTKPTIWPVHPAKTQISLGIHPV